MTTLSKELDLLASCHHEVAHALAAMEGGLKVERCRVKQSWFGSSYGYCRILGPTTRGPQWAIDAYAVFLHAGEAASGMFMSGHGVPCAAELAAHGAGHDRGEWDLYRPFSTLTDGEAWQNAVDLVTAGWWWVSAAAQELARRGRLTGRELSLIS